MCLTAIFMPLSSANVIATVYDVTVPEVRSTAQAVEYFVENMGAAFAPLLTGLLASQIGLPMPSSSCVSLPGASVFLLLSRRALHD